MLITYMLCLHNSAYFADDPNKCCETRFTSGDLPDMLAGADPLFESLVHLLLGQRPKTPRNFWLFTRIESRPSGNVSAFTFSCVHVSLRSSDRYYSESL